MAKGLPLTILSEIRAASRKVHRLFGRGPARSEAPDARYYESLHARDAAYRGNNWLVGELPLLASQRCRSLIEIGCGNGLFLAAAASRFEHVSGCYGDLQPGLRQILTLYRNLVFYHAVIPRDDLPLEADIVVSADVLEHFPAARLSATLGRIDAMAPRAFHKIACYDDGHSHLSIFSPDRWLAVFQQIDQRYELLRVDSRRGKSDQHVAVIAKGIGLEAF